MKEMDYEAFKNDMIKHITQLRTDVSKLQADVGDLRVTVKVHEEMLRCRMEGCDAATPLHNKNCALSHTFTRLIDCSDHRCSMLSKNEIAADFDCNRQGLYAEGGDCGLAAAIAWEFFNRAHRIMSPKLVDAVMYSPSARPVLAKSYTSPAEDDGISPIMVRYERTSAGGCIWQLALNSTTHGVANTQGAKHRVVLATTCEGERVVVDWGISQFSTLPLDIGLFIRPQDL